jgi:uncharacterized membrane-anchored protein YhcB (DUF1043 family)
MPNLTASNPAATIALLAPLEVIETMIELRIQVAQLEQQIQSLQPAFFAACASLNTEKITHDRATISRRLTPGQWAYAPDVLKQEALFKHLKQQFQKAHEPTGGREVTWAIKLLLTLA